LNRFLVAALLSLPCLSTLPALAQSSGSTLPYVTLSVGGNPTASGVSLTGTVQPETPGSVPHPTGTVTFFDGTTVLNASGIPLTPNPSASAQTFAQVFGTPDPAMAQVASDELVGDFDGDGKDDLLLSGPVTSAGGTRVQLFVSSNPGQGNFRALQPQIPNIQPNSSAPVALDVDGDGKLDLLLGQYVIYGNGDGTFSSRVGILPVPASNYAADVNGDGKLDIIGIDSPPAGMGTSTVQFAFTVFRNDGSGTFTSVGTFPFGSPYQTCCAASSVVGLSFGDVNGDGKLDVVSQMNSVPFQSTAPVQFDVLLNNGDGTFGTAKPLDTSALQIFWGAGVAFGDLNADGKEDLVLAYNSEDQGTGYLAAALGNGDGTFGPFSQLKLLPIGRTQVELTDFDGDGKLDAILSSGDVALGKGDGTFAPPTSLFAQPASPQIRSLLQMPIYAHSSPSLVFLNLVSGSNAVFTPQVSSSASTSVALSAGTHTLTAHYSGDSTYAAAVSLPVDINVAPAATSTALTSSSNPSYAGQSVTFNATIAGLAAGAGGTVTFSNGSTTLGTATVSNGSASYTTTFSSAGNQTITATYGGDATDAPSSGNISQSVVVSPISFPTPPPSSTTLTGTSGSAASGSVTINAIAGYSGAIFLSCSGLPANASCSFTPQIPAITAPSGTYGIIVATGSPAPVLGKVEDSATPPGAIEWCDVSLLGLLLMGRIRRSRVGRLCLVLAAGVLVSLTGCGGSGKSTTATSSVSLTPPGTYTFQLNAATSPTDAGSPSPAVSQTYTLIVQ
jgi:hypothetical protein